MAHLASYHFQSQHFASYHFAGARVEEEAPAAAAADPYVPKGGRIHRRSLHADRSRRRQVSNKNAFLVDSVGRVDPAIEAMVRRAVREVLEPVAEAGAATAIAAPSSEAPPVDLAPFEVDAAVVRLIGAVPQLASAGSYEEVRRAAEAELARHEANRVRVFLAAPVPFADDEDEVALLLALV